MKKYVSLTLILILAFISTKPILAFEQDSDLCATLLSHDERLNSLSSKDRNIIVISAFIASQLSTSARPIQINQAIIFLSDFVEVKIGIDDQNKEASYSLSSTHKSLFNAFAQLGILKDMQEKLLNQLGLSSNNLGPFSLTEQGRLTLHLDTLPSISTVNRSNYDDRTNTLLDNFKKFKEHKKETPLSSLTFLEYAFLDFILLEVPPIQRFLSNLLDTNNAKKISQIFYQVFKRLKTLSSLDSKEQSEVIQKVIRFFQELNMTLREAARRLGLDEGLLYRLVEKHEKINGRIPGR